MIVADIDTMKMHIATIVGDDFNRYKPYLKTAENWLKREITGSVLFPLIESDETLEDHCQAIVAHKAYLEAIPFLDLVETESGFAVTSNQNLSPASTKRVEKLTDSVSKRLDECVEDLLEYLEEHDDETILNAWVSSNTYTLINDNYIRSIREFRQYGRFPGTRLQWIEQRYRLAQLRQLHIEPVISRELSQQIIEQLRDDEINEHNKRILDDLRYCLAALYNDNIGEALSHLARVHQILVNDPDDYPLYKESDIYAKYKENLEKEKEDGPIEIFGL